MSSQLVLDFPVRPREEHRPEKELRTLIIEITDTRDNSEGHRMAKMSSRKRDGRLALSSRCSKQVEAPLTSSPPLSPPSRRQNTSPSGSSLTGSRHSGYRRHRKPPYSWQGLVAAVIVRSPGGRLTVSGIAAALRHCFPYLGSGYQGWRDSIRHNLSQHDCFSMESPPQEGPVYLRRVARLGGSGTKRNLWTVNLSVVPPEVFRRQTTPESRGQAFPSSLWEYLDRPDRGQKADLTTPSPPTASGALPDGGDTKDPGYCCHSNGETGLTSLGASHPRGGPDLSDLTSLGLLGCVSCSHINVLECFAALAIQYECCRE